jgi:hypothetical protein
MNYALKQGKEATYLAPHPDVLALDDDAIGQLLLTMIDSDL